MAQHSTLFIFFVFLCRLLPAQDLSIATSIALADDFCSFPIIDPDTDCINAPLGSDTLIYNPGNDGEILITYRLTNSGSTTITMLLLTDSDQGTIIPVTPVSIAPGSTITTSRVFPAKTTPEILTPIITASYEDVSGLSYISSGSYYLEVTAPSIETEITLWRSNDICIGSSTDPIDCIYNDVLSMETPVLGSGEVLVIRARITNTGSSTVAHYDMEIPELGQIAYLPEGILQPGTTSIIITRLRVPDEAGTYNYDIIGNGVDWADNSVSEEITFTLIVDCSVGDEQKPTAICQDITIIVADGQTTTITPQQINNGSYDECGLASGSLDRTDFTCADIGEQEVVLSLIDQVGNNNSCRATVTVEAANEVAVGPTNNCVSLTQSLSGASNTFVDITDPQGKLLASVRRNANVGVANIQLDFYRGNSASTGDYSELRAGRQLSFTPLDWAGNPVTPVFPLDIRIYYHAAEIQALIDSTGHDPSSFQLVKDDESCGNEYSGLNAVGLTTDYHTSGCGGATHYYEASTAELSTFYLFGYGGTVSLTAASPNQPKAVASLPKDVESAFRQTAKPSVHLYPNPASNQLFLNNYSAEQVIILDAQGKTVLQQAYQNDDAIKIGHLPAGLYFLRTPGETIRWIKQ